MVKIDEDRRRQFERHRLGGGDDPIEDFLPPADAETYAGTLEELILIDVEVRWKAWVAEGCQGRAPTIADYREQFPPLVTSEVEARLRQESSWLAEHYGSGLGVGRRVGRYRLRARLGRGAFAEVWRAHDADLDREIALKVPCGLVLGDPLAVERMQREAQAAARLSHPGIVSVFEVGRDGEHHYVACELIEGPTLAKRLRDAPVDARHAADLVARLSDAVGYAHACGVVHRDIKPSNVLLDSKGVPRLADFGMALLAEAEGRSTREGDLLGTPAYMAPEQARGDVMAVGPAADVYALGVLLYELLAGRPPFQARTAVAVLRAVLREEPEPPGAYAPTTPGDLATICLKAMSKEPDRRYQSAEALAADLRRFLARKPIHARPQSRLRRARLWVRRNRTLAATILFAHVAVGVVGALGLNGILSERARFQEQRDDARTNLGRSLMRGAEAYAESRSSRWYERALGNLTQAATLLHTPQDRLRLRDMAARVLVSSEPRFASLGRCKALGGSVTQLALAPRRSAVAGLGQAGRLWIRALPTGEVVASVDLGDSAGTALAWTPDGKDLLLGLADGRIQVRAGADLRRLCETAPTEEPVGVICVHAESGTIAVGRGGETRVGADRHNRGGIDLLRIEGDRLRIVARLPGHEGGTHCIDYSPDGKRLGSGGEDGVVRLWDIATGREHGSVSHPNPVRHLAHGPSAEAFASAFTENHGLFVHQSAGGQLRLVSPPQGVAAGGVVGLRRLSADKGYLSAGRDGQLRLHRLNGDLVVRADAGHGPIHALDMGGPDPLIVAAHKGGELSLWRLITEPLAQTVGPTHRLGFESGTHRLHVDTGVILFEQGQAPQQVVCSARGYAPLHPGMILASRTTRDGSRNFVLRQSGAVQVSARAGSARLLWPGVSNEASWLVISSDGAHVAAGSSAGLLRRWSADAGDVPVPSWESPYGLVLDACFLDGSSGALLLLTSTGLLRVPSEGPPHWIRVQARRSGVLAACGRLVAVGNEAGTIELLDPETGTVDRTLHGSGVPIVQAVASPSGLLLLVRDLEGMLRYWDLAREEPLWEKRHGASPLPNAPMVVDPAGRFAMVGDSRGMYRILDLSRGAHVAQLAGGITGGAIDVVGKRLIAAGRGRLQAWDLRAVLGHLAEGRRLASLGRGSPVTRLWPTHNLLPGLSPLAIWGQALSPDGRWLAQTDHAGIVDLIRTEGHEHVRELAGPSDVSWTCAFSPDSATLAAGIGTQIHLFDLPGGGRRALLEGHAALVRTLAYHPRLPLLVSAASDGTVRLWDLESSSSRGQLDAGGVGVRGLAFHPDGGELVGARSDGSLVFWRVPTAGLRDGAKVDEVIHPLSSAADCVAYSASGRELVCGAVGGGVCLLDARDRSTLLRLETDPRVRSVAFTSDGQFLAASSYAATARVWDLHGLREHLREMGLDWSSD